MPDGQENAGNVGSDEDEELVSTYSLSDPHAASSSRNFSLNFFISGASMPIA